MKDFLEWDEDEMKAVAFYIANVLKFELGRYCLKHMVDDLMPSIRDAVYTSLYAFQQMAIRNEHPHDPDDPNWPKTFVDLFSGNKMSEEEKPKLLDWFKQGEDFLLREICERNLQEVADGFYDKKGSDNDS